MLLEYQNKGSVKNIIEFMRRFVLGFWTVFFTFNIHAQTDTLQITHLEEVAVTGYRNQAVFSPQERQVTIIPGSEIAKSGIQNFQDLLEFVSNADIRERGQGGVQADVSIRGGTFDHVMILINGINFSDPQTGHASLDIPVDPEMIDRIEVLSGSAARILGAGAFTGAINVVTRTGVNRQVTAGLTAGQFGFGRVNLNAGFNHADFRHVLSIGSSRSDGYTKDTDFDIKNAFYRLNYDKDDYHIDVQAGFQDKKFGAADFYSPRFGNQYEETGLWFASVRASAGNRLKISPSVYYRHRRDHYILERSKPELYENFHLTDVFGSQVNAVWNIGKVRNTVGVDIRSENILSNNIGFPRADPVPVRGHDSIFYDKQYGRTNLAWFQEHDFSLGNLNVSAGLTVNWNTAYPNKPSLFPGIDLNYQVLQGTQLFFGVNRALHLPTFTDLFYTDPVNQGNIHLAPNRMISYEGGIRYSQHNILASACFFNNSGKDIIDWLWSYKAKRFSPVNLEHFRATGVEAHVSVSFPEGTSNPLRSFSLNYVWMDLDKSLKDSVSKYDHIRNKLSLALSHQITRKIGAMWTASFQDRAGQLIDFDAAENAYYSMTYHPYWLIDGTLFWHARRIDVYATVNNLLNTDYTDAGSVNQPGRWFKAGITLKLGHEGKD
jgi:vitamin B12 transporter